MGNLPHLGQVLRLNARLFADRTGARDLDRSMTFRQWNDRSCRLANALTGLGLAKGDRVVVEGTLKLRDGATVREMETERAVGAPSGPVPSPPADQPS